jgi:hypothetical protein
MGPEPGKLDPKLPTNMHIRVRFVLCMQSEANETQKGVQC